MCLPVKIVNCEMEWQPCAGLEVKQLVEEPKLENLEMAAQLLEDSCGDVLKWLLKVYCPLADLPPYPPRAIAPIS